jgi:hypothetical protein
LKSEKSVGNFNQQFGPFVLNFQVNL